ncbi:MAG: DUF1365 family protein, partial [Gordonia sp. (in: high G+C Gram-positive bacteria)]
PAYTAAVRGRMRPATLRAILAAQCRAPLAPWVVALRIRFHGVRLWRRGLPVQPRPVGHVCPAGHHYSATLDRKAHR